MEGTLPLSQGWAPSSTLAPLLTIPLPTAALCRLPPLGWVHSHRCISSSYLMPHQCPGCSFGTPSFPHAGQEEENLRNTDSKGSPAPGSLHEASVKLKMETHKTPCVCSMAFFLPFWMKTWNFLGILREAPLTIKEHAPNSGGSWFYLTTFQDPARVYNLMYW